MTPTQTLAQWSAAHHGVVTLDRLRRLGFSDDRVAGLLRDGTLVRACRAVYVVAAVPPTREQRWAVAVAATAGAISHVTAGTSWTYRGMPPTDLVHVTIPHGRVLDPEALPDGVVVHRSRSLPSTDLVRRRDGIVVTSPPRTLFDLAAVIDVDTLESAIEQGIDRRMLGVPTLWGVARRLATRGRPGSTRFVDVLASRTAWIKPVGSNDELVLARALVAAGLPEPVRQHPIVLRGGRTVHADLCWPDIRLAIEVDHVTWHGGRVASTQDKRRDRHLRLRGWEVDRVTDRELRDDREATVGELVELHAERTSTLARAA